MPKKIHKFPKLTHKNKDRFFDKLQPGDEFTYAHTVMDYHEARKIAESQEEAEEIAENLQGGLIVHENVLQEVRDPTPAELEYINS